MPTNSREYDRAYYKKNKDKYQGSTKFKKRRARMNKANRLMKRKGKIKKGDGNHVDHIVPLSKGGSDAESNLRVISAKENQKKKNNILKTKTGKLKAKAAKRRRKKKLTAKSK